MGETPAVIGELRHDFAERNTALFLLLGLLSLGDRLTRTLAAEMAATRLLPAPAAPPTRLDYLALGLVAVAERFAAVADRMAAGAPAPAPVAEPARPHADLMR